MTTQQKLTNDELNGMSGAVVVGTYENDPFTVTQNSDGTFEVTSGDTSADFTPDQARALLKQYLHYTDEQVDKAFVDIASDQTINYGEVAVGKNSK